VCFINQLPLDQRFPNCGTSPSRGGAIDPWGGGGTICLDKGHIRLNVIRVQNKIRVLVGTLVG
jgi:hypothetical protein